MNKDGISKYGLEVAKRCKKIYLENYTVEFPYETKELEQIIGKKIVDADREKVEGLSLVDEARKKDVGLLVYGSPLFATTHITLIDECKKSGVKYKVVYAASVFDAVAETGLQLYKFGKIGSIPEFEADSFLEIVKNNQKIGAHSMLLVDIGLSFEDALGRLESIKDNVVVCSRMGTERSKIVYGSVGDLEGVRVKAPFCFIVPGKLHFVEQEILEGF